PYLTAIMEGLKEKELPHEIYYYLEACGDVNVRKLMAIREAYPAAWRRFVPLEAFCVAAETDPQHVLTVVMQTIDRLTSYSAAIRMAASKKEVVNALVTYSLMPDNTGDRELFMKATGMLPQSKGSQTLIQVTQNASHSSTPQILVAPPPEKTIR